MPTDDRAAIHAPVGPKPAPIKTAKKAPKVLKNIH